MLNHLRLHRNVLILLFFLHVAGEQATAQVTRIENNNRDANPDFCLPEIPSSPINSVSDETLSSQLSPVAPSDANAGQTIASICVRGSTLISDPDFADDFAEVKQIMQSIVETQSEISELTDKLNGLADNITQVYLEGGYITSRAKPATPEDDGIVGIQVIEGEILPEDIRILRGDEKCEPGDDSDANARNSGTTSSNDSSAHGVRFPLRINDSYLRRRIELGTTRPLNQNRLEDQLRLLRLDPLFDSIEASIRAKDDGQSILCVRITEADPFQLNFAVNNYSPASVGSEQVEAGLTWLSPTGLGDALSIAYTRSTTGGAELFDLSYRLPLNPLNGTLELRAAPNRYKITEEVFAGFDIRGEAELYEFTLRQPLVRSPREEFALSLGFTYRDGQTLISDLVTDDSTTSVIRLGQEYLNRDTNGAWAILSQFNLGVGLFDATALDAGTDGQFISWLGQVQRLQILNSDNLLIFQVDAQFTPDPLLPSQQFVIGGGESIRGYRQNARLADNGFRLSIEDRIVLNRDEGGEPRFQVAPFAEIGSVWNDGSNPVDSPDQTFLAGIGAGVLWRPLPNIDLNLRLDYGLPLVDLDDREDNLQDEGIYFSVNLEF